MKKLDKFWVALDRALFSIPWWNWVLIIFALVISGYQILSWIDCSNSGGRFMKSPFGFYECIK